MKKLTRSQWEQLNAVYGDLMDSVDDYGISGGGHYMLVSALNAIGHRPNNRDEAMEMAEKLLAQGYE